MKRRAGYFGIELIRGLKSWKFPAAVVCTVLFWLLTIQGRSPSSIVDSIGSITTGGIGNMFVWAFPTIVCAASVCEDLEHRYIWQMLLRGEESVYRHAKLASVFLSAWLTMFLGYWLYIGVQTFQIPLADTHVGAVVGIYARYYDQPLLYLLLTGMQLSTMAATLAVVSLTVSTFIQNKMVIYVTPTLFLYIEDLIFMRFMGSAVGSRISLLRVGQIALGDPAKGQTWLLAYFQMFIVFAVAGIVFELRLKRRMEHA